MTDTTRDLLISLASHMAYMQGQLEAHHEHDDPEDYYWYRESVRLRQKVTDVLADEPAVPGEGREPASVITEPSDEELLATLDQAVAGFPPRHPEAEAMNAVEYPLALELRKARAVLARWGNLKGSLTSSPPADGEVAELVEWLREESESAAHDDAPIAAARLTRTADLLKRLASPPVAIPGEQYHEDMGSVTWWRLPVDEPPWVGTPNDSDWPGYHTHFTPAPPVPVNARALPLPEVNNG